MGPASRLRSVAIVLTVVAVAVFAANCKKKHRSSGGVPPGGGTPTVLSVTPNMGDMAGGINVTILSSDFTDFTADPADVTFGANLSPTVTPVNATTLLVEVPASLTAGPVDVTVTNTLSGDTGTLTGGFTYSGAQVTSVTPNSGDVAGNEFVTIDTINFIDDFTVDTPQVFFGADAALSVLAVDIDTVQVVTPPHPTPQAVDVEVRATNVAESDTLPLAYTYTQTLFCTLAGVSPPSGLTFGGEAIFITGTNFETSPLPTVEFGAGLFVPPGDVAVLTGTRIRVYAPPSTPGTVDIIVTTSTGSCSRANAYTYNAPPTCNITGINPTLGPDTGGTPITIDGTGFTGVSRVWLGATEVTPVNTSGMPTQLRITTPPGTGTVDVTVDIGGSITCSLLTSFTYLACQGGGCNLQQPSPNSGGVNTPVMINGTNLEAGAIVLFGNDPNWATATVTDGYAGVPTQIQVLAPAPAGGGGTVDIQVRNPSGPCCTRNNAFTYTGCLLQSVLPGSGPESGGQSVSLDGTNFPQGASVEVWFGSALAPFSLVQSGSWIVASTPPGVGTVDVCVIDPVSGDSCCLPNGYSYAGCYINSITPSSGGTNGGDIVTILGSGFDTLSIKLLFGGVFVHPDNVTVDPTGTSIICPAPPSSTGGAKTVEIINEALQTRCTTTYTYSLPGGGNCSISSIMPSSGSMSGGTVVTISGTGFDANTGVIFGGMAALSVVYNPGPGTLTAETPPYVGQFCMPPCPVDVWVCPENSNPCLSSQGYAYDQPSCPGGCTVTSVTPSSGSIAGNYDVTINGAGFCVEQPEIYIDQVACATTYVDANTIIVTVPPGAASGTVSVVYQDGSGCVTMPPLCFCFTYN